MIAVSVSQNAYMPNSIDCKFGKSIHLKTTNQISTSNNEWTIEETI